MLEKYRFAERVESAAANDLPVRGSFPSLWATAAAAAAEDLLLTPVDVRAHSSRHKAPPFGPALKSGKSFLLA